MAFLEPKHAKSRVTRGLILASLVLLALAAPASAAPPTVEQMLGFKPRQEGIDITMLAKEEYAQCEVKLETGKVTGSSGWLLLDAKKQPVRRYFDSNGDKKIDVWSYYKDGVEVYREIDTNFNDKPDQYRWFNSAGTKWGVDANEDGKIDSWKMISPEEVAQEAYLAVVARDFARLRMLFITEDEMRTLKMPEAHVAAIREAQSKAPAKFQDLCAKATNLNSAAQFVRVESAVPHCVPADAKGPLLDMLRFPSRVILYQAANKSHEWLHTGEMILVGQAWRLVDAPSVSDIVENPTVGAERVADSPVLKKLMEDLMALDKSQPNWTGTPGKFPAVVDYAVKRVGLLEKIVAATNDANEKEANTRQILDNLCTGHQANEGDNALLNRLTQYKTQLAQSAPGSGMAGYAHYREMWARFAFDLAGKGKNDPAKTQRDWNEELAKFVAAFPKAEDAPEALLQLAMSSEYAGKDKQEEAKKYYGLIASNFPEHPLTPKAVGAVKRLDLNGKPMQLSGPTLQGGQFDIAKLNGKVVVVYYWASNCRMCVSDFAVMKQLHAANSAKGLEIVTVNLDETPAAAMSFLSSNTLPATHLYLATDQAKGLESPLATQYGIVGMPTIILVGKDGRVIDRSIQITELEDAIKKAQ